MLIKPYIRFNTFLIWPVSLMALIFTLSSIPMDICPNNIKFLTDLNPTLQNLLHIPLYGALSFLWLKYFLSAAYPLNQAVIFTIIITIGYGCLDEIHQSFVPGRYGGLMDILLNSVGAILGVGLCLYMHRHSNIFLKP